MNRILILDQVFYCKPCPSLFLSANAMDETWTYYTDWRWTVHTGSNIEHLYLMEKQANLTLEFDKIFDESCIGAASANEFKVVPAQPFFTCKATDTNYCPS